MRYILERIREENGQPVLGTIDTMTREYANDGNASRFMAMHLRNGAHFREGKYRLSTWPRQATNSPMPQRIVGFLYK